MSEQENSEAITDGSHGPALVTGALLSSMLFGGGLVKVYFGNLAVLLLAAALLAIGALYFRRYSDV